MAGLFKDFWDGAERIALECLAHPFVRGLGDGTLSQERYVRFIAQDAFFLDVFARGFAAGVLRAPDAAGRRMFHELQAGVFQELKLHASVSQERGLDLAKVVPMEAALGYTDFLLANALTGGLGELIASMTPCMALYGFIGRRLADEQSGKHAYTPWIETYAGAEFADQVRRMETLLDMYGEGTDGERDRYQRAMQWEWRFFDEAWRGAE